MEWFIESVEETPKECFAIHIWFQEQVSDLMAEEVYFFDSKEDAEKAYFAIDNLDEEDEHQVLPEWLSFPTNSLGGRCMIFEFDLIYYDHKGRKNCLIFREKNPNDAPPWNVFNSDINPKNYHGAALSLPTTDMRLKSYQNQRAERGFDDSELWSLDCTIASFIAPRLKAMSDDPVFIRDKEFLELSYAFEAYSKCKANSEEAIATIKRLFPKHFTAMWN